MFCVDPFRTIQRRAITARLEGLGCNHSFHSTGISVHLEKEGALETATHDSPRTTMLYDRPGDDVTLEEIK